MWRRCWKRRKRCTKGADSRTAATALRAETASRRPTRCVDQFVGRATSFLSARRGAVRHRSADRKALFALQGWCRRRFDRRLPPGLNAYPLRNQKRNTPRSEEHTSELQSREKLVCRL